MEHKNRAYSGNLGRFRSDFAKPLLVMTLIKKYFTLEKELPLYQRDIASCVEIETELGNAGANADRLTKAREASDNARAAYEMKKQGFIMMKQDISDLIDKVDDITLRTLLKARILERKTSSAAASTIHYSTSATTKMYMSAITELDIIYRNESK